GRAEVREAHEATTWGRERSDYTEHRGVSTDTDRKWERSFTLDRAAPAAARSAAGLAWHGKQPVRSRRGAPPLVRAPPARHAIESVGRARLEDRDTACGLAYYAVSGRLHEADDPAAEAALCWISDPQALIVVEDQDQERRVRAEIARLHADA